MAKRTTQLLSDVEFVPEHKVRTTQLLSDVEYIPEHKVRTTQMMVMVEYTPIIAQPGIFTSCMRNMKLDAPPVSSTGVSGDIRVSNIAYGAVKPKESYNNPWLTEPNQIWYYPAWQCPPPPGNADCYTSTGSVTDASYINWKSHLAVSGIDLYGFSYFSNAGRIDFGGYTAYSWTVTTPVLHVVGCLVPTNAAAMGLSVNFRVHGRFETNADEAAAPYNSTYGGYFRELDWTDTYGARNGCTARFIAGLPRSDIAIQYTFDYWIYWLPYGMHFPFGAGYEGPIMTSNVRI